MNSLKASTLLRESATASKVAIPRRRMVQQRSVTVKAEGDGAKKLWGGRFTGKTDPLMEKFNESLPFDKRMWAEDIRGSKAYAKALSKCGILTEEEATTIIGGLSKVSEEWEAGKFEIKQGDEDIHTANERRLTELIGAVGGKLHTGRSRNDQVATDTRLWLYKELQETRKHLHTLIKVAADRSEAEADILMPGALAGNPFGVDRQFIAQELGMIGGVCPNSMDAVSDRDFVLEFLFFSATLMTHLSRWAEDLIIYSSGPFGFVQCSDAYATGSSLMPQKKNPDALELIRGKAGRVQGNLAGAMAVMKGAPTTYNKDFQECWELMYDTLDTVNDCVRIATGVLSTVQTRPEKMLKGLSPDMLATDLAEYLVRKGIPFRETHHISGAAVKMAEDRGCTMFDLTVADLQSIHPLFGDDVVKVWDYNESAEKRDTEGGVSKRSVLEQVQKMRSYMAAENVPLE